MKTILKALLLLFFFTIIISCNKTSTEPEPQAGRRDYTWTVDTLNSGTETLGLTNIWGTSPQNIWAVGNSSWSATTIWHFNGVQWRCDSIPRYVNPFGIFGLSSAEVWLGNANNTIWKYNGSTWSKFGEYKTTGYNTTVIQGFDGLASNSIYGVGLVLNNDDDKKATVIYYNGYNWSFINIPKIKVHFENIAVEPKSGILVISGMDYNPVGYIAKIYCWDGKELKELLSEQGWSYITKIGDEIFASGGSKIYKYSERQLILWKNNEGTSISGRLFCGRSHNDFFLEDNNGIAHYNGTGFETIYKTNLTINRGIIFENDVFFIAVNYTLSKSYIIHGKLKKE